MANAGSVDVNFNTNIRAFNRAIDSGTKKLNTFGQAQKTATASTRALNRVMNTTASNVDRLRQSQGKLNTSVNTATRRVDRFSQAQIAASANVRALSRAIAAATRRLDRLGVQNQRTQQSQSSVSTSTIAMGNIYAKMGEMAIRALTSVAIKMKDFAVEGSKMAVDMESSLMRTGRVFGDSSKEIIGFMENQAKALNLSKVQAIRYSATFGNLLKNMGRSRQETAEYTKQLLRLAAVIKSQESRFTMDEILDKLRSGVLGNIQAIDDLGIEAKVGMITSTKAFKQFAGDKSWDELSFKTQQQIRLMAILEQGTNLYGTTLADTTANKMSKFTAAMDDAKLKLGEAFLPLIERAVPLLVDFAEAIEEAAIDLNILSEALFGKKKTYYEQATEGAKSMANSQEALGDAVEDTEKKMKKSLGTFDEINLLPEIKKELDETVEKTEDEAPKLPEIKPIRPESIWRNTMASNRVKGNLFEPGDPSDFVGQSFLDFLSGQYMADKIEAFFDKMIEERKKGMEKLKKAEESDMDPMVERFGKASENSVEKVNSGMSNIFISVKTTIEESIPNDIKWNKPVNKFDETWGRAYQNTSKSMDAIKGRVEKTITDDIPNKINWEAIPEKFGVASEKDLNTVWGKSYKNTNDSMWSIKERVRQTVEVDIPKEGGWDAPVKSFSDMWDRAYEATVSKVSKIVSYVNAAMSGIGGGGGSYGSTPAPSFGSRSNFNPELGASQEVRSFIESANELISNTNNNSSREVVINIDGVEMGRGIIPYIDAERQRQGNLIFSGGGP